MVDMVDIDILCIASLVRLGLLDHANIYVGETLYLKKENIPGCRPFYVGWKRILVNDEYCSGCWIRYD